jgi:hypothetical protein
LIATDLSFIFYGIISHPLLPPTTTQLTNLRILF